MRRLIGTCLLIHWLVSVAIADPPKAAVTSTAGLSVPAGYPVLLDATTSVCDPDQPLQWQVVRPASSVILTYDKKGREAVAGLLVTEPAKAQVYTIAVTACAVDTGTHKVAVDTAVVEIQAVAGPAPPNPPNPPNPPLPPNPPTPAKLARVIMVYESSSNLSRSQYNILTSTAVRAKLSQICPQDSWRCWDKDVDVSGESSAWRSAWASLSGELSNLPALVLFDDRGGHLTIPLPTTVDDFLAVLERYAR